MAMNYTWQVWDYINTTNITGIFEYANSVTGNMFMNATCFAVFVISFTLFRKWSDKDALAASGFVTTVLSMLLWAANLINAYILVLFFLITAVGVFMQSRD